MKTFRLIAVFASAIALSACSDVSTANLTPEEIKAQAIADLSKMDVPEIIDFVDEQARDMTELLETITDGPSAEAAVEDIRLLIPKLNASLLSLEDLDVDNLKLNIGMVRRMMKVAQSQSGLFTEVSRISQIPEARAVLEKEFDKIELTNF